MLATAFRCTSPDFSPPFVVLAGGGGDRQPAGGARAGASGRLHGADVRHCFSLPVRRLLLPLTLPRMCCLQAAQQQHGDQRGQGARCPGTAAAARGRPLDRFRKDRGRAERSQPRLRSAVLRPIRRGAATEPPGRVAALPGAGPCRLHPAGRADPVTPCRPHSPPTHTVSPRSSPACLCLTANSAEVGVAKERRWEREQAQRAEGTEDRGGERGVGSGERVLTMVVGTQSHGIIQRPPDAFGSSAKHARALSTPVDCWLKR